MWNAVKKLLSYVLTKQWNNKNLYAGMLRSKVKAKPDSTQLSFISSLFLPGMVCHSRLKEMSKAKCRCTDHDCKCDLHTEITRWQEHCNLSLNLMRQVQRNFYFWITMCIWMYGYHYFMAKNHIRKIESFSKTINFLAFNFIL